MRVVECIKVPPMTEYKIGKRYNCCSVFDGDLLQYNVSYEDGTDSAFSPQELIKYFMFDGV